MGRILIADRDPRFSLALAQILAPMHTVVPCENGAQVQSRLLSGKWDVLVLDLMLPGWDGIGMVRLARTMAPGAAIVLTTAFCSPFLLKALKEYRVAYILQKPCRPEAAAERVQDLLGRPCPEVTPEKAAVNLLSTLGVPHRAQGYRCLREALVRVFREPEKDIGPWVFEILSETRGGSRQQAVKSAQSALNAAWKARYEPLWRAYFPDAPDERPTVRQFLNMAGRQYAKTIQSKE